MKQNILKFISQSLNEKVTSYFVSHSGIKKSNTIGKNSIAFYS